MTDKELIEQWLHPVAIIPVTMDSTRILVNALRARLSQCDRCGKTNPAEIHTCTPEYIDRRQWRCDPMTGEPLVDGWPLYSGLPQPEPKPVAWIYNGNLHEFDPTDWALGDVTPLYTAPPQREWQVLTDKEIEDCLEMNIHGTCRAIEAKLKEKNK